MQDVDKVSEVTSWLNNLSRSWSEHVEHLDMVDHMCYVSLLDMKGPGSTTRLHVALQTGGWDRTDVGQI